MSTLPKPYIRPVDLKFLLLWGAAFLLISAIIYFLSMQQWLAAVILFLFVLLLRSIKIHGLTITDDGFYIRRYSVFGLKRKNITVPIDALDKTVKFYRGGYQDIPLADALFDIIFVIIAVLYGRNSLLFTELPFESGLRSLKLHLSDHEYETIRTMLRFRPK